MWPPTEDKVWWDDLAERLAATFPGLYGAWTGEQVTAAVRPHGLKSIQIKRTIDGKALNRRGLARTALAAALDDRTDGDYTWPLYHPTRRDDPDRRTDRYTAETLPPTGLAALPVAAPLPTRLPAPLGR